MYLEGVYGFNEWRCKCMREKVSYVFIVEYLVIESKVSELNYLLGLAFRAADWTLGGHL